MSSDGIKVVAKNGWAVLEVTPNSNFGGKRSIHHDHR
jgi:hypothetical protein